MSANSIMHDYGLMLYEDDFKKYEEENDVKIVEMLTEEFGINLISGFDGTFNDIEQDYDIGFYFLTLSKYPSLFEKAYESREEAIKELKEKIGEYLSDDFNWEERFGEIYGYIYE